MKTLLSPKEKDEILMRESERSKEALKGIVVWGLVIFVLEFFCFCAFFCR